MDHTKMHPKDLDSPRRELSNGVLGIVVALGAFSGIDFVCVYFGRPIQLQGQAIMCITMLSSVMTHVQPPRKKSVTQPRHQVFKYAIRSIVHTETRRYTVLPKDIKISPTKPGTDQQLEGFLQIRGWRHLGNGHQQRYYLQQTPIWQTLENWQYQTQAQPITFYRL